MKKYPLIGISIAVVFLIIVASFTNVVGVQTVEQSNNKAMQDQKDLLFQTIIDIVNDKEVQSVVSKYHSGLFHKDVQTGVLTMKQLNSMYLVGSVFSKRVDRLKVHSLFQNYRLNNQELLDEIDSVIENNAMLNMEMEQLELLNCDCEANEPVSEFFPPVICAMLWMIGIIPFGLYLVTVMLTHVELEIMYLIWTTTIKIGQIFNCPGFY